MPLGMPVGHGPGHTVLDGDPAPTLTQEGGGTALPNFRPMSVVAKGLGGLRFIWYGGRPRPTRHCVRWRPRSSPKKGHSPLPTFRPMSIVAKQSPILTTAELFVCKYILSTVTDDEIDVCKTLAVLLR